MLTRQWLRRIYLVAALLAVGLFSWYALSTPGKASASTLDNTGPNVSSTNEDVYVVSDRGEFSNPSTTIGLYFTNYGPQQVTIIGAGLCTTTQGEPLGQNGADRDIWGNGSSITWGNAATTYTITPPTYPGAGNSTITPATPQVTGHLTHVGTPSACGSQTISFTINSNSMPDPQGFYEVDLAAAITVGSDSENHFSVQLPDSSDKVGFLANSPDQVGQGGTVPANPSNTQPTHTDEFDFAPQCGQGGGTAYVSIHDLDTSPPEATPNSIQPNGDLQVALYRNNSAVPYTANPSNGFSYSGSDPNTRLVDLPNQVPTSRSPNGAAGFYYAEGGNNGLLTLAFNVNPNDKLELRIGNIDQVNNLTVTLPYASINYEGCDSPTVAANSTVSVNNVQTGETANQLMIGQTANFTHYVSVSGGGTAYFNYKVISSYCGGGGTWCNLAQIASGSGASGNTGGDNVYTHNNYSPFTTGNNGDEYCEYLEILPTPGGSPGSNARDTINGFSPLGDGYYIANSGACVTYDTMPICVSASTNPALLQPKEAYDLTLAMGNVLTGEAIGVSVYPNTSGNANPPGPSAVGPTSTATGISSGQVTFNNMPPIAAAGQYQVYWSGGGSSGSCPVGAQGSVVPEDLPYFKVFNGGVEAGSGFASSSCNPGGELAGWNGDSGTYPSGADYGASADLIAMGIGTINGFASNQSAFGNAPTNLTFANNSGVTSPPFNYTANLGGNFGGSQSCLTDPPQGTPETGPFDPSTVSPISGQQSYYVTGNVVISNNVVYAGGGSWSLSSVPSLIVHATGNIYIDSNVTELDGTYIAGNGAASAASGHIYTCTNGTTPLSATTNPDLFNGCKNQLVVYGSFVAPEVDLMRTFGTLHDEQPTSASAPTLSSCSNQGTWTTGSKTCAAEVFYQTPELYLPPPPSGTSTPQPQQYDAITSLPPVL